MTRGGIAAAEPTAAGKGPFAGLSRDGRTTLTILVVAFVFLRLSIALSFRPGGYVADASDFGYYSTWGLLSFRGLYPYLNYWVEYPPIVPWLSVGIYRLATLLPRGDSWGLPDYWFRLGLSFVFALADVGNLVLVARLAWRLWADERALLRAGLIYALALAPAWVILGHMDLLPLFFLLLALDLTLSGRQVASGVATALGVLTKLFPVVAVMVAFRAKGRWRWCAATALALLAGLAPFLLLAPTWVLASARAMVSRQPWESVWALLRGYYSFGTVAGDHFDPAAVQPGGNLGLPYYAAIAALGLLLLWLYLRRWPAGEQRGGLAITGMAMAGMLLIYPGFSPQFVVWLVPFVALLLPNARGVVYSAALGLLLFSERVLYFMVLPGTPWLLTLIVAARSAVFLAVMVEMAGFLVAWRPRWCGATRSTGRRQAMRVGAGVVTLGLGALVLPRLLGALHRRYRGLNRSADALNVIDALGCPDDGVIVTSDETFVQMRPYLGQRQPLLVTSEDWQSAPRWQSVSANLAAFLESKPQVWMLQDASQPLNADLHRELTRLVEASGYSAYGQWLPGDRWLSYYAMGEADSYCSVAGASFVAGPVLAAAQVEAGPVQAPGCLRVRLTWSAATAPPADVNAFLHLLAAEQEGAPVAQRDVAVPLAAWQEAVAGGGTFEQSLAVAVPAGTAAGHYRLAAGLYDPATGERLMLSQGGDAITLCEVEVVQA